MLNLSPMVRDTPLEDYMPLPRAVLALDISATAKLLYALLLDRATLSQKSEYYKNKQGYVYVIFPVRELGKALGRKDETVRRALNELEGKLLVTRFRGPTGYNQLFVSVPDPPKKRGAPLEKEGWDPSKKRGGPLENGGSITTL